MSLLGNIISLGATIFGGPAAGAAANGIVNAFSSADKPSSVQSIGSGSQLADTLRAKAFMQGFMQQLGTAPQAYNEQSALQGAPLAQPASQQGLGQQAQQYGGRMGVPGGEVSRVPGAMGLGSGDGKGAGTSDASLAWQTTGTPMSTLYQNTLRNMLSGGGGLPQSAFAGAVNRGMYGVNQQALQGRSALSEQMAAHGMANSGAMAQGLQGLENQRMASSANLFGGLEQQNIAAQQQAQQAAMGMVGSQEEAERNRLFQVYMQQKGYEQNQPNLWSYLSPLAGAAAQYYYGRQTTPTTYQNSGYQNTGSDYFGRDG